MSGYVEALTFFTMLAAAVVLASWLLVMAQPVKHDDDPPTLNTRGHDDDPTR